jgi:hypothetical protein
VALDGEVAGRPRARRFRVVARSHLGLPALRCEIAPEFGQHGRFHLIGLERLQRARGFVQAVALEGDAHALGGDEDGFEFLGGEALEDRFRRVQGPGATLRDRKQHAGSRGFRVLRDEFAHRRERTLVLSRTHQDIDQSAQRLWILRRDRDRLLGRCQGIDGLAQGELDLGQQEPSLDLGLVELAQLLQQFLGTRQVTAAGSEAGEVQERAARLRPRPRPAAIRAARG